MTLVRTLASILAGWVFLTGCASSTSVPEPAAALEPATEAEKVADAYMKAITSRDWTAMAEFLTEDSVYRDHTMTYFEIPAIDLSGPRDIVEFWRESSESTDAMVENHVKVRFTAGPWVILVLRPHVSVQGEAWDVPGRRIEGTFDQITVLKVDGDKILHHVDHVDYAEVMEVVDAARATIR